MAMGLLLPGELMKVCASHHGTLLPVSAQRITRGGEILSIR